MSDSKTMLCEVLIFVGYVVHCFSRTLPLKYTRKKNSKKKITNKILSNFAVFTREGMSVYLTNTLEVSTKERAIIHSKTMLYRS